jgi:hypothetical protein
VSNFTQVTDFGTLITAVQGVAPFAEFTVIAVFLIAFISLSRYETKRAVVSAFFISFLTSSIFFFLNTLGVQWIYFTLFATAASAYLISD